MDFRLLEQFESLAIKFIFVYENESELSHLLSELNGFDYRQMQIAKSDSIVKFIDLLPKIPVRSDPNIIVKACHLIKQLINKQKILLPEIVSSKVIDWILKCCDTKSLDVFFCEAIDVLTILFKTNPKAAQKVGLVIICFII